MNVKVKERVDLYLYSPYGPSRHVVRWTLPKHSSLQIRNNFVRLLLRMSLSPQYHPRKTHKYPEIKDSQKDSSYTELRTALLQMRCVSWSATPHHTKVYLLNFLESILFCFLNKNKDENKHTRISLVSYGCETSSLALREAYRIKLFEHRVLRGIVVPNREEVTLQSCYRAS
jgi:hypothetical protein